jgi:aminoethylphosphonate catabolism LysR family transcriptional regulator
MRLTQLRSFHAVARAGGFTGAAKLLHISQPTVTTQVRFLEESYGVELFWRRGRSVQLTPVGKQLLALATQIFALESDAVQLLGDSGALRSGLLRLGAVGPYHATEMVAAFARRYPEVQVSVRIGNSEEALQGLLDYQTDVAVLAQYADDPRFHEIPYARHPIVVFVHRGHRFARRRSISIRDLEGEPLILREAGSTTRKSIEDALARAGVRTKPMLEIGSREAIREAVAKGLGIGAVSEVEFVPDPSLRVVRIEDAQVWTNAHVVCLRERRDARLVRAFLEIVDGLLATRTGPRPHPVRRRAARGRPAPEAARQR